MENVMDAITDGKDALDVYNIFSMQIMEAEMKWHALTINTSLNIGLL